MNKTLVIISAVVVGIALFAGGIFFGQVNAQTGQPDDLIETGDSQFGSDMMDDQDGQFGSDMMDDQNGQFGSDMMDDQDGQFGSDMMGNQDEMGGDMMGMMMGMGSGMMGDSDADPLSIEDAETAVSDYLATLDDSNLQLGEVMIFDNQAYAQILDSETGIGAFEVVVDPVSHDVYPEPGPNMMWNSEFGMASGNFDMMSNGMMGDSMMGDDSMGFDSMDSNMMDDDSMDDEMMGDDSMNFGSMNGDSMGMGSMGNGGMMGSMMSDEMIGGFAIAPGVEISVTADEAIEIAQQYLDKYQPDTTVDEAVSFPGYYTLHIEQDGEITGMLSVNAYTGQVFTHQWHGDFIEMSEANHN